MRFDTVTDVYKYGPYGEPKNALNQTSFAGSRFRYTGQTVLPEAQLYYYKARVYDPIQGRFLQTDPVGSKDDLNLYGYVGGDPINSADPDGMEQKFARNLYGTYPVLSPERRQQLVQEQRRFDSLRKKEEVKYITTYTKAEVNAVAGFGGKASMGTFETRKFDTIEVVQKGTYVKTGPSVGWDISGGVGLEAETSKTLPQDGQQLTFSLSLAELLSWNFSDGAASMSDTVGFSATPISGTVNYEITKIFLAQDPSDETKK